MSISFVCWLMVLVSLTFVADIVKAYGHEQVIESLHIKSDIRNRFAITHISQVIRNIAPVSEVVRFVFKIPYGALLQSLRAIVAGIEYDAKIVCCQDLKYNPDRSPGHAKSIIARRAARGEDDVSFWVYATTNSTVTFKVSYQQQLHRYNHSYEHEVYLPLTRPLEKAVFEAEICENKGVTSVKTPRLHPKDPRRRGNTKDFSSSCKINHILSQTIATLRCRPKVTQSFEGKWYVRFALQYAVKVLRGGRDVVKEGDYFAFFMAPERMHDTLLNNASEKIPKDVICVSDLALENEEQVGLLFAPIIHNLNLQDRLNVFRRDEDSSYRFFSPNLVPATDENQHEALLMMNDGAYGRLQFQEKDVNRDLLNALKMMHRARELDIEPRARMIIFFTDTYPTREFSRGGRSADDILRIVAHVNKNLNVSIYSIAVGDYANLTFLQSLSQRNYGFVRHLPEGLHDQTAIHRILHEINSIVFTNLRISFPLGTVKAIAAPLWFPMVLNGTEVQIFGQLGKQVEDIIFSMEAFKKDGEQINVTIEEKLRHLSGNCDDKKIASTATKKTWPSSDGVAILEKIWAFASLTQLIARLENYPPEQLERASVFNSMIDLAMKYKLVTPFTRMVFTPDPDSTYESVNCFSRVSDHELLIPIGPTPSFAVRNAKPTKPGKLFQRTCGVTKVKCATLKAFTVAIRTPQDQFGADKSICIIPCQWRPGKVLIFSNPGIMKVTLHLCQKPICPQKEIWRFIRFKAGADYARVLGNYVNGWVYKATSKFQVNVVSKDELEVFGFGLRTRIYRLMVNGLFNSYKFNITQEFPLRIHGKAIIYNQPIPAKFGGISGKLLSDTEKSLNILKTDHAIQMCRDHPARFQALLRREKVEKFIQKANCGK